MQEKTGGYGRKHEMTIGSILERLKGEIQDNRYVSGRSDKKAPHLNKPYSEKAAFYHQGEHP